MTMFENIWKPFGPLKSSYYFSHRSSEYFMEMGLIKVSFSKLSGTYPYPKASAPPSCGGDAQDCL